MPSSPKSLPRRRPARPRRRAGLLSLALCVAGPAACGSDTDPACDRSYLRYENFGAPFLVSWCRPCHSAQLPPDLRQDAPLDVNFDTVEDARSWAHRIVLTTGSGGTMPPAGGPSDDERALLVEWLRCGGP